MAEYYCDKCPESFCWKNQCKHYTALIVKRLEAIADSGDNISKEDKDILQFVSNIISYEDHSTKLPWKYVQELAEFLRINQEMSDSAKSFWLENSGRLKRALVREFAGDITHDSK